MAADEDSDPRPEEALDERAPVDVVGGVGAQRPPAVVRVEPPEVVHEPGDLQLDVVGV